MRLVALVLALLAVASAQPATDFNPFQGIPGVVNLGDTVESCETRLGRASARKTQDCSLDGHVRPVTTLAYPSRGLLVRAVEDRVYAIYLGSPSYQTLGGLKVGATFGQFRAALEKAGHQRGQGVQIYKNSLPLWGNLMGPNFHNAKTRSYVALLSREGRVGPAAGFGFNGGASWDPAVVDVILIQRFPSVTDL